ncbi:hypothetical protein FRB96_005702 [Tulasnella sp. 330]|nr:hypothetical protein FRB96_005702 [Tulasnella sp. 330]
MSRSLDSRHSRIVNDMLGDAKSLASDAAAVALDQEQPQRAVELLEQGRGILLAQLAQYRTALDDLQDVSPGMAAEFTELSAQLEQSVTRNNVDGIDVELELGVSRPDAVGRHQNLSMRWKEIVNRIRGLSGFTTFLQPTPFHLLAPAADEGPVIIINVSTIRSDAIILQKGVEPDIVKLPDATYKEVKRMSSLMEQALGVSGSDECEEGIKMVLRLLWEFIVQFIVQRLEERGLPRSSRIWWCPTSASCLLPLHAAGIYQPDQPNLPDIYISSYTRTLSTLIRARNLEPHSAVRPSILAIGVPEPDGDDGTDVPLQFVDAELDRLMKHVPGTELLEGLGASHDAVVARLPTRPWIHIACHGHQDSTQPFQSRFRLQDKPLTLREVVRMNLPNAEFAFLSACNTATGDRNTPDEGLHLATGMQFSGFRGVVGTLWAMDDVDGPDVVDSFYKFLFRKKKDGKTGDYKEAAKGVSRFTKMLRSREGAREVPFERWVNFIHVGA